MLPSKHGVKLNLQNLRVINDAMWIYLSFPVCNIQINFMFGQTFDTTRRGNGQNNDEMMKWSLNHAHGADLKRKNMDWTKQVHMCLTFDVKCEKWHHLSAEAALKL